MSTVEVGARSRFVDHARGVFTDNFTSDTPNSWMSVDLGEGRQLAPDCYSLRHGYASHHFRLMNWRLEASNDAETWTTMRTHTNDATLPNQRYSTASRTASWSVQSILSHLQPRAMFARCRSCHVRWHRTVRPLIRKEHLLNTQFLHIFVFF